MATSSPDGERNVPELSIVVAVHDEQDSVLPLVSEVAEALAGRFDYELIFVDDGSEDATAGRLRQAAAADRRVRFLRLAGHPGQTAALQAGFRAARGRLIATLDGDGQNVPADLPRLIEALAGADIAIGYRRQRRDNWWRRLTSHVANGLRNRLTGARVRDVGCATRVFRAECLDRIKLYDGLHRFFPTLFELEGYRLVQLPVDHRPRASGRTKYGTLGRLRRSSRDLLAVRWMKARQIRYRIIEESPHDGP